ncbi:transmembrane amino acid transporter [Plectosphaerella plurivora]|uniref:Transmembrane amino acid transporter n=1 Tax=Plectosphaerella plurivora TaxID=936078 RepID=A0A9P9A4S8_9PEZI|nr:transmembrane amino acid transporter [Plectosphaerella plurivora]
MGHHQTPEPAGDPITHTDPEQHPIPTEKSDADGSSPCVPAYSPPARPGVLHDETGDLIDFKTLTWWQGGIVMVAETVSLGILSLPSVLASLGLIPGIILILFFSATATYSCLILADFRKRYPHVQHFGDAVEILGRPIGMGTVFRELFGLAQTLLQLFLMGGHILMWTICMNTLSNSSMCTVLWAVIGAAIFWVLNLPRTLQYTSWMSLTSCISVIIAVLVTTISVGIEKPIQDKAIDLSRSLGFLPAFLSVANIGTAFASHAIFFSVIAEFKNPDDWPKALALLQITDTSLYIVAAVVIYVYVGPDVPSPALSAASSSTVRKAIWGIAIPTIAIAGVIYAHVAAKYIFTRIFGNTKHAIRRTKLGTVAWIAITLCTWIIGLVIAESIPVFNSLLGLIAAAFGSWFSFGLPGLFWMWMYYGEWFKDWKQICRFAATCVLLLTGLCLFVVGLWASIDAIANESVTKPWTCASNAAP